MSTPTIRDLCAALSGDVDYLIACIQDGSSDSCALQECLDRANTARDLLAAEPVGEVGVVVADLRCAAASYFNRGFSTDARRCRRAATLLSQQQHLLTLAGAELDRLVVQQAAPAPEVVPVAYDAGGGITIHRTRQEPEAWAVCKVYCLALDGTWSYERAPSDRTQEWLARHRFASAEAAAHAIPPPQAGEVEG